MLTLIKFLRSLIQGIASNAAPWQMAIGAGFGVLLGFLPIFPLAVGPSLLGLSILFCAIIINCHFASVMLFMGLGKLLGLTLLTPAVAIGNNFSSFASASADIPFLHYSLMSHTGYLGLTVLGFIAAPMIAIAMWTFTLWFRTKVQPKLLARKKLILTGKVASNPLGLKLACWFMGI
jgi:hypothetical protein